MDKRRALSVSSLIPTDKRRALSISNLLPTAKRRALFVSNLLPTSNAPFFKLHPWATLSIAITLRHHNQRIVLDISLSISITNLVPHSQTCLLGPVTCDGYTSSISLFFLFSTLLLPNLLLQLYYARAICSACKRQHCYLMAIGTHTQPSFQPSTINLTLPNTRSTSNDFMPL